MRDWNHVCGMKTFLMSAAWSHFHLAVHDDALASLSRWVGVEVRSILVFLLLNVFTLCPYNFMLMFSLGAATQSSAVGPLLRQWPQYCHRIHFEREDEVELWITRELGRTTQQ